MKEVAKICKALSVENRLKIIKLLADNDALCVKAIVHVVGTSQSAVSQHLNILKNAGLVVSERRGYWIHYSLNKKKLEKYMGKLLEIFKETTLTTKNKRR